MEPNLSKHDDDVRLAARIVRGSTDAWHEFVARYSGLILTIAGRYLAFFDEDDRRDTYVRILEYFYKGGLRAYDGEATLGTWVITVSRSRCLDAIRSRRGRHRDPAWLPSRSGFEKHVYRLYFLESQDCNEIQTWFRDRGQTVPLTELLDTIDRLDRQIDPRVRTRIAYDLQARSVGITSGRLLEFLDHLRIEHERHADTMRPDFGLFESRTRELLGQIHECVQRLDETERRVVQLHFYDRVTAGRIAEELELPNSRHARTLVERALTSLRRMLKSSARRAPSLRLEIPASSDSEPNSRAEGMER